MSRVVLSGYYGFHNLGDDAVLAATAAALRARHPGIGITVLSRGPDTGCTDGVERVPRSHPGAVVRVLRTCDLFLSGGGSLFQDATSWRSPWYYLGVLALAQRLARRTAVYAQGIGPLRGRAVRAAARRLLNRVDLITLRDRDSLAILDVLGVERPPVVLAGDPALLLSPRRSPRVVAEQSQWGKGLSVGLALRPWGNDSWCEAVVRAARIAAERHGVRWICLPMHRPGDLDLAVRVAAQIGGGARVVLEPIGPEEMLALIGGLGLVVGMRLHALIFAAMQGVPCVALAYDPKISGFVRELGEPLLNVGSLGAESLVQAIASASADLGVRGARVLAAVAPLRVRAQLAPTLVAGLVP